MMVWERHHEEDKPLRFKRIYVEITNVCNLSCPFCPPTGRARRFMTAEEFDSILAAARPYANYVFLHVRGEPLCHPDLAGLLEICARRDFLANITTNGTLLPARGEILLRARALRQVNVSLHSFGGPDGGRGYVEGVLDFAGRATRETGMAVALRLWNMSGEDEKDRALGRNRELLDAIASRFGTGTIEDRMHGERGIRIGERLYLNHGREFVWPSLDQPVFHERGFCLGGKNQLAFLCDGSVVPCCLDAEGVMSLGNAFETPLEEILEGGRLRALTEGFERRVAVEELCKRCGYRMRFGVRQRKK